MEPSGSAIGLSLMRANRPIKPSHASKVLEDTLSSLCEIQKIAPSNLEIRTLNYPMPFGASAVDPNSSDGIIFWENYTFNMPIFDIPKLVVASENEKWFTFLRSQMLKLWEAGTPWQCKNQNP